MTWKACAAVLLIAATGVTAQSTPPTAAEEVPPHDITRVDPAPLDGAISVPIPEADRRRMMKYDIPELVGARQALGSQLVNGELPKPVLDYVARDARIEQRLSLFEGGLVVVKITGAGGTIRKRLIIPSDAVANYLKQISPEALSKIRQTDLGSPREGRQAFLRVYRGAPPASAAKKYAAEVRGAPLSYVERSFDPVAVLPKPMNDQVLPLQDLLRAIYEDRGITNTVAGYIPAVGDQLVADDRKVYKVTRIIDNSIVELKCLNQPTLIYVAVKDLYNYFIGTTGAARQ